MASPELAPAPKPQQFTVTHSRAASIPTNAAHTKQINVAESSVETAHATPSARTEQIGEAMMQGSVLEARAAEAAQASAPEPSSAPTALVAKRKDGGIRSVVEKKKSGTNIQN